MFDETLEHLNEMCRALEDAENALEELERCIKAFHGNFVDLKPYLFQPSEN